MGRGRRRRALVDPFAEPRNLQLTGHLLDAAAPDVGDEQARRVRPEVDRGDAGQNVKKRATR